jgi:hypothetical protein
LAIEIDGDIHKDRKNYDENRGDRGVIKGGRTEVDYKEFEHRRINPS